MNQLDHLYCVILAGGKGERLWPLSRQDNPKQLLPFAGDTSLLEQTIARIASFIPKERRVVVTTVAHQQKIEHQVGDQVGTIIGEPAGRNTAPAIIYTCLHLQQRDPHAIIIFLPADHYIQDQEQFKKDLLVAVEISKRHNSITLLGLKPTFPATGYGYIAYTQEKDVHAFRVAAFHEKPSLERAEEYYCHAHMLWNIGIFCASVTTFINECERTCPELLTQVREYSQGLRDYNDIFSTSFDYAVLEKSNNVWVVPAAFDWSDVGNLEIFLALQKISDANVISYKAHNNLVYAQKLVALLDVDDLCVVETADVILIAKRSKVEDVKNIVKILKDKRLDNYS